MKKSSPTSTRRSGGGTARSFIDAAITTGKSMTFSRFLLLSFLACMYVTLSGHWYLATHQEQVNPIGFSSSQQSQTTEEGEDDDRKVVVHYPLTRRDMLATGASMGRSFLNRIKIKQQTAAALISTNHDNHNNNNPYFWCRPKPISQQKNFLVPDFNTTTEGFFFVKTPKTASQSINRILRRMVSRVGPRALSSTSSSSTKSKSKSDAAAGGGGGTCHLRGHHIQGDPAKWYQHRHDTFSFLMTSVRDPAARAMSRIYWNLSTRTSTGGTAVSLPEATVDMVHKALLNWRDTETGCVSDGQGGFQLNYISFPVIAPQSAWTQTAPTVVQNPHEIHGHVARVLQDYDFIMIQERLEESLVAFQLVLGLEPADILSMPLHVGGSYLYDRHAGCIELKSPPKLPHLSRILSQHRDGESNKDTLANAQQSVSLSNDPLVTFLEDYFQSPTWYAQNYGDYVMMGAAHASLDQTIADLGRDVFDKALEDFRKMQQVVLEVCSRKVVFPCSRNGTIQREDYQLGSPGALGDRYPQRDIEACIDQVVVALQKSQQN